MILWDTTTTIDSLPALKCGGPAGVHEDTPEPPRTQESTSDHDHRTDCPEVDNTRVLCRLVALNYACLVFRTQKEGLVDADLLQRLVSETFIDEAIRIVNEFETPRRSDLHGLLELPIFQRTLTTSKMVTSDISTLADFLLEWFAGPSERISVSIFTNDIEVVVCLKITIDDRQSYLILDSSAQTNNLYKPSLKRASQIDQLAISLHEVLRPSSPKEQTVPTTNFSFSALLLTQKLYVDEQDTDILADKDEVHFSGPSCPELDPLVCPPPASQHTDALFSPQDTIGAENLKPEAAKCSDVQSLEGRPQWEEFVWQLSLQNRRPDSIDHGVDGGVENSTGVEPLQDPIRVMHNDETISSEAGLSRTREDSWLASIARHQNTVGYVDTEIHERVISSGTPKSAEKSAILIETAESHSSKNEDEWQTALLQQLQEEEEIASTLPHQDTSEFTWLVSLQKSMQAEESLKLGNYASTSISRSELDWQLAVQLQQQIYQEENPSNGTPRIVVESVNDDDNGGGPSRSAGSSGSNSQSEHLRVPERRGYGDSFDSLNLYEHAPPEELFQCGVCGDMNRLVDTVTLQVCSHRFCRGCVTLFVKTKIEEGKYPIFCPECLAERSRTAKTHILQDTVDQLDLSAEELRRLCELEMISHSVALECPRCRETMNVDRDEYSCQSIIVCPIPRCTHKWCKNCLKTVASSEEHHRCKNGNIDRLMKRKGWKYCPGCRTPVQKESGCNHMTCGAPGCNVHFCYRCGVLMIDTTNGGDVGTAVTDHYNDCRLFEKRFRCSIQ